MADDVGCERRGRRLQTCLASAGGMQRSQVPLLVFWIPDPPGCSRLLPGKRVVTGLNNGDVQIVDASCGEKLETVHSWQHVHGRWASTALAVSDETIVSGGEDGSLVQLQPSSAKTQSIISGLVDLRNCPCHD